MFEFHTVSITFLRPVTVDGWIQTGVDFVLNLESDAVWSWTLEGAYGAQIRDR